MESAKKYDYVAGIADLVTQMTKPVEIGFGVVPGSNCTYCGAAIKNVYFVRDSAGYRGEIGSECVKVFAKYLGMDEHKLEKAIKFFEEYRKLASEAHVSVEAAKNLEDLLQKIEATKALVHKVEMEKQVEQGKVLDKVDALEHVGALSAWETAFVKSLRIQVQYHILSSRQMEIANKIATRSPEEVAEVQAQRQEESKVHEADMELMTKLRHIRLGLYDRDFIASLDRWVFDSPRKPLTEAQRKAALKMTEKYRRQIEDYAKEYPSWNQ